MGHDPTDLTEFAHRQMPFAEVLDLEILDAGPHGVVGRAPWREDRCTAGGVLHGGYLMALADSVGAICAALNMEPGSATATIESKTNFLRAVRSGQVGIEATPVHVGRTTIVVQTDITRDDGKLVSRTLQTQTVTPGEAPGGDAG